jgi:hypothetical protein
MTEFEEEFLELIDEKKKIEFDVYAREYLNESEDKKKIRLKLLGVNGAEEFGVEG